MKIKFCENLLFLNKISYCKLWFSLLGEVLIIFLILNKRRQVYNKQNKRVLTFKQNGKIENWNYLNNEPILYCFCKYYASYADLIYWNNKLLMRNFVTKIFKIFQN